jgi:DNA-binding NtrC family response regulator
MPDMYTASAHQIPERPILEQVTRAKRQAETEVILATLNSTRWNRKQAAVLLKVDYKALLYKMKSLGIEDKSILFEPSAGVDPIFETAGKIV